MGCPVEGTDLQWALESNPWHFEPDEIAEIVLELAGQNDGDDWHWIVRLHDGRWAYITGGCDYTGWDCRSFLDSHEAATMDEAIAQAGEVFGPVFRDMLRAGDDYRNTSEVA